MSIDISTLIPAYPFPGTNAQSLFCNNLVDTIQYVADEGVDINSAQTITGAWTFSAATVFTAGITVSGGTNNITGAAASDLTRNVVTGQSHIWKINNVETFRNSASGAILASGTFNAPNGTIAAPSFNFGNDTDTGMSLISSKLALVFGGAVRADNDGTTWDLKGQVVTTTGAINGALATFSSGAKFAAAGAASGTLTHYEENGTFVPTFAFDFAGTSSFGTYLSQSGRYTRIGDRVFFEITIQCGTFSVGTATGGLNITGLPYVSSASAIVAPIVMEYSTVNIPTGGLTSVGEIGASATTIQFYSTAATGPRLSWAVGTAGFAFQTNSIIRVRGHYEV